MGFVDLLYSAGTPKGMSGYLSGPMGCQGKEENEQQFLEAKSQPKPLPREIRVYVTLAHSLSAWTFASTSPGHLSLPSSSSEPLLPHTPSAISFFFHQLEGSEENAYVQDGDGTGWPKCKSAWRQPSTTLPQIDGWTRSPSLWMAAVAAAMAVVWVLGFICLSLWCLVFGSPAHVTLGFAIFPANQN